MKSLRVAVSVFVLAMWLGFERSASAVDPAFTYQGVLSVNGSPGNGFFDLRFALFHTNATGVQVGNSVTNTAVPVTNGLFTVTLNFGSAPFTGTNLWLEIAARSTGGGAFSTLAPRQALLATPHALRANNSDVASGVTAGAITTASLANGAVTSAKLASNAISQVSAPDGTPSDALRVNTNGLVGIGTGTNAPVAGLHVSASAPVTSLIPIFQAVDGGSFSTNLAGPFEVAVRGNLMAVAARDDNAVLLLDVSNPSSPIVLSEIKDGVGVFTNLLSPAFVAFSGNNLVISAGGSDAVSIVSVTNPTNPILLTQLIDGITPWMDISNCQGIAVSGTTLAIASQNDHAVTLVDISNPAAPIHRSTMRNLQFGFNYLHTAFRLSVSGSLLAIAALETNAVTLADISDPTSPIKRFEFVDGVGGYDGLSTAIAATLNGNRLAMVGAFDFTVTLVDVTTPASPVRLAVLTNLSSIVGVPVGAALSGNRLVVGGAEALGFVPGLAVFDISIPTAPKLLTALQDNQLGYNFQAVATPSFFGTNLVVPAILDNALSFFGIGSASAGLAAEGWVGIGTTIPVAPLTVVGDVVVQNAEHFSISARHVSFGLGQASGNYSTAMGRSLASGEFSVSMGNFTEATGVGAVAMGNGTIAGGKESLAVGNGTTASGDRSVAMGDGSIASGTRSFAIGFSNHADGEDSFAGGIFANALHDASFVWSDGGTSFSSTAPGQFLISASVGIRTNITSGSALNVRGNVIAGGNLTINSGAGTDAVLTENAITQNAASNTTFAIQNAGAGVMSLTVDGNLGVGTNNPAARMHVNGNGIVNGLFSFSPVNISPTAGSTLFPTNSYVILTAASAVTLSGSTAIADGSAVGSILILQGNSEANLVTVNDGANTQLGANRTLGSGDTLMLIYNGSVWVELAFANN